MKRFALTMSMIASACYAQLALGGPLDPDCTAEKAARSAATKATVGVGGRCDPKEAAADTAKRAAGVEDKGPVEKRRSKNDTPAEKVRDAVK
jgi:accessory colonization factor AcfC